MGDYVSGKGRILTILSAPNKPQGLITPAFTVNVGMYRLIQGHFFFVLCVGACVVCACECVSICTFMHVYSGQHRMPSVF